MDDFKPEDELKPDTSDRRPQRSRKPSSAPKVPVSRQQMMMGIGILVLLLIVIGIGSTLTSSGDGDQQKQQATAPAASGSGDKNIDLSGSASISGQSGAQQPATDSAAPANAPADNASTGNAPADNAAAGNAPQELSAPPVSSTPTEAQPLQTPAGQQRVELPGDLNNALSSQQGQVDSAASGGQESSLPTGQATVAGGGTVNKPVTAPTRQLAPAHKPAATSHQVTQPQVTHKAATSKPAAVASESRSQHAPAKAAPAVTGGNYTLQLSSASRSDTLNAWAKKQNLSSYHVYKTTRNGQPWYVLVSGAYATPADAKRAVASLPAEVQAKSPWVKPVSQVKKESEN